MSSGRRASVARIPYPFPVEVKLARTIHAYPLLHNKAVRSILKQGRSIEELAAKIGIEPTKLSVTVARFNTHAARGDGPQSHRGEAAYDKMYGDPRHGPNPCLRPLNKDPYYAMPIYPGDIGTNGGLLTNTHAQVVVRRFRLAAHSLRLRSDCSGRSFTMTGWSSSGAVIAVATTPGPMPFSNMPWPAHSGRVAAPRNQSDRAYFDVE